MAKGNEKRITRGQMIRRAASGIAAAGVTQVWTSDSPATALTYSSAAVEGQHDAPHPAGNVPTHRLIPVPIQKVTVDDAFWSPRFKVWRDVTIGDCFTKFENDRGGAINNFDLVRDGIRGKHAGPPWYDGLIYEMIRGAADFLAAQPDPALESRLDGYVARIVAAQAADKSGYLNTWTQSLLPQAQRWGMNGGDDRSQHDIYNAGMMIEAGIHYYRATGKTALLGAATRMANLMCATIGPPPRANVIPGHSGPEEALVKLSLLYRDSSAARTNVSVPVAPQSYLELAEFFIDARGHYAGRSGKDKSFGEYGQDHAPLAQQKTLEGHAVRATLFCTGIAAAALVNNRADYRAASLRLWDSLDRHKLYISGAAGAIASDEKLGPDYFLPNDGYMETCAAAGLGFFGHNMNQLFGDAHYVDELERALYNAALGGVALTGDRYYYQNPLVGDGLCRWEWHDCPCCPPMFLKLMGALPSYIYAQAPGALYVNLFIGNRATIEVNGTRVQVEQKTHYPWDGHVRIAVSPERPTEFDLFVRIPGWASEPSPNDLYQPRKAEPAPQATLKVNGRTVRNLVMQRSYARLRRRWKPGDVVELILYMPVRQVKAHHGVKADEGLVALMRGPLLYCVESVDNPRGIQHLFVPPDAAFTSRYQPDLLGGVHVVHGRVNARISEKTTTRVETVDMTAIPFYASANREPCAMCVWLPGSAGRAVPASLAMRSRASASHCWRLDSVGAINDGNKPAKSSDTTQPRLSWWDHKGTSEWAQLDLPHPAIVSKVQVFWFADRPVNGGCDLPESWRLMYRAAGDWKPVDAVGPYGNAPDHFNEVAFTPVTTTALRFLVRLRDGWSGGICEIEVS